MRYLPCKNHSKIQRIFLPLVLLSFILVACTKPSNSTPTPEPSSQVKGTISVSSIDKQAKLAICNALNIEVKLDKPVRNVTYNYNLGDGTTQQSNSTTIQHTYAKGATYQIEVDVKRQGTSLVKIQKEISIAGGDDCIYIALFKKNDGRLQRQLQTQSMVEIASGIVSSANGKLLQTYQYTIQGFAAQIPYSTIQEVRNNALVQQVGFNSKIEIAATQELSEVGQWGLDRIDQRDNNYDKRYTYLLTGAGIDIYIVDTGLLTTHNEFRGRNGVRLKPGTNVVDFNQNNNVYDCNGHGTHVASIAAGTTYGVAKEATIIPVKAFPNCSNNTYMMHLLDAIEWIMVNRAKNTPSIINMSLSFNLKYNRYAGGLLRLALNGASERGVHIVAAAGNKFSDACNYSPAVLSHTSPVITVGGMNRQDRIMPMSNEGKCVSLFAPGQDIIAAGIGSNNAKRHDTGTSMATPHVAGVLAQYLQANPQATPAQAKSALLQMATKNELSEFRLSSSPNLLLHTVIENVQPNIRVRVEPSSITLRPGQTQSFTATVTGTEEKRVQWSFTGGTVDATTNTFTLTAPQTQGTYTLTATSRADTNQKASATITVAQTNQAPTAALTASPTSGVAPLAVAFDATGSTDDKGIILK